MLWDGDAGEFSTWFMSLKASDADELANSLASVPDDSWLDVWVRLYVAIHDEQERYLPIATNGLPNRPLEFKHLTQEDHRNYEVLEKKERILADEMRKRQQRLR